MRSKIIAAMAVLSCVLMASCKTLQPYERVYINDPEMQMGESKGGGFVKYVHSIREGANPSGKVKSSGGCGCN